MARHKKESKPVTIRMAKPVFDSLEEYCDDSGQSKTTAIERALKSYIKEYYKAKSIYKMKGV